jgi:hypothetical protein
MLKLFDTKLPCAWALLEYAEGNDVKEFDLTFPSTEETISQLIAPKYPHLVEKFREFRKLDPRSCPTIDSFFNPTEDPTIATFEEPTNLFSLFNLSATILTDKTYFATVAYLGRNNEVRVVYRDAESPNEKTNVHDKEGKYMYDETLFKGNLPEKLNWAMKIQSELLDNGTKTQINHYKLNEGYSAKVYFRIHI